MLTINKNNMTYRPCTQESQMKSIMSFEQRPRITIIVACVCFSAACPVLLVMDKNYQNNVGCRTTPMSMLSLYCGKSWHSIYFKYGFLSKKVKFKYKLI